MTQWRDLHEQWSRLRNGTLAASNCGELLVLTVSTVFWQDIDAAYLFQDMGDIDDDLSSLLVPDLDFSSIVDLPQPSIPKIPQTGEH